MRSKLYPVVLPQSQWTPRDYQVDMLTTIEQEQRAGHEGILVTAPPGAGKTGMMAEIARRSYLKGLKTTIVVSQSCLVTKNPNEFDQTLGALIKAGLGHLTGVVAGDLPKLRNEGAPIQVVMLQSLKDAHWFLADSNIVIIDEAHTSSFFAEAENIYTNWDLKCVLNFTATPFNRSQGQDDRHGSLIRNTAIVVGPTYRELEKRGYLASLRYHSNPSRDVNGKLDLESDTAVRFMLTTWRDRCEALNLPLTHAVGFVKAKNSRGIQGETIARIGLELGLPPFIFVGDGVSQADRDLATTAFLSGQVNLLCVHSLSTGWDCAEARHALMFRPIPSRDRCVQAATRVDRPHESKSFGEIWDFAGNFELFGPDSGLHPKVEDLMESIDSKVLHRKQKSSGEAPKKTCCNPKCKETIYAAATECPKCQTLQPPSSIVFQSPSGEFVSLIPPEMVGRSEEWSIAFFRQWRAIGTLKGWSPYAAHKKCADLGLLVKMKDDRFWLESTGLSRAQYCKHLNRHARSWGWDEAKVNNELIREFG